MDNRQIMSRFAQISRSIIHDKSARKNKPSVSDLTLGFVITGAPGGSGARLVPPDGGAAGSAIPAA
jgi:hypothetical protein